ncbi:unnamed protein product, partial [Brassica oleracea]
MIYPLINTHSFPHSQVSILSLSLALSLSLSLSLSLKHIHTNTMDKQTHHFAFS